MKKKYAKLLLQFSLSEVRLSQLKRIEVTSRLTGPELRRSSERKDLLFLLTSILNRKKKKLGEEVIAVAVKEKEIQIYSKESLRTSEGRAMAAELEGWLTRLKLPFKVVTTFNY